MIRRNIRLRKDYIYQKSQEAKERAKAEKKERLRKALDEGRMIDPQLRRDVAELAAEMEMDDAGGEGSAAALQAELMDNEYANAGVFDPRVVVTTSREPSVLLKQFAKEIRLLFPNAQRINRGGYRTKDLMDACRENNVTDLVVVQEHRGIPDGLVVCHFPFGPTAYFTLANVVTRHEIKAATKVSEAYPHLIFHGFTTRLGQRVADILKYLFPVPKDESKRVMSFINEADYISFRHHVYEQHGHTPDDVELVEVGPRFELRPYKIVLGTLEQREADSEWELRPYHNTAKKRRKL
ncbi:U3 small nucleolar ribonucleoprotein IMP4 [Thecamonas trahens ATCC 50062]|uniref:U3 small nucleolar ribonucleoprotein IMP4 n=1 Tax=Thecamonas trahens ATCC 50062 TaxID=461836 RepID=A0A0L0DIG7_THETB|nr:U3 small nucleolar ribonucleoprotein IMP4 [Thecamonas trahens ATCC 50062]KNC52159.1 U3 small nucleolar ribonucleoprotein IMP4 [Thecamonas trahens ATCC 50062]|eukprot:XP_013762162.1 U3 small nucleolar ribonucleoprotein IMP4 [Thecamonas trahens ATCC 50062]